MAANPEFKRKIQLEDLITKVGKRSSIILQDDNQTKIDKVNKEISFLEEIFETKTM